MASSKPKLSPKKRDQLVEDHLGYVRSIATRVRRDLNGTPDFDELVAYGSQGLVEAANRYDPTRGVAFTTFSYYRIRGAIFDGLRAQGWLSRSHVARFQASADALLENLSERPSPSGPVPALHSEARDLGTALDQIATIFITSLDDVRAAEPVDTTSPSASEAAEMRQTSHIVREAITELPERERELVELHYFKGLTIEAAGKRLGMSKSWASRLHARAIAALTERLGPTFTQDHRICL